MSSRPVSNLKINATGIVTLNVENKKTRLFSHVVKAVEFLNENYIVIVLVVQKLNGPKWFGFCCTNIDWNILEH